MHCSAKAGFWSQSVLSILLGGGLEKESNASCAENGKHTKKTFLIENYELSLKVENDLNLLSTKTGKEHVYCVESYTISYVLINTLRWCMLPAQRETMSCTKVYVQGSHWIGSIFNSNLCDQTYLHWFLRGYLVTSKESTQAEVMAYST